MANIVITSTTNTIKVDFGTYSSVLDGQEAGCYQKADIDIYRFSDRVRCVVKGEKEWSVVYAALTGCFIIDSIDGASPSSNSDLYTKLIALTA